MVSPLITNSRVEILSLSKVKVKLDTVINQHPLSVKTWSQKNRRFTPITMDEIS